MKSKFLSMILIISIVLSTMNNALAIEEYNEEELTKYDSLSNLLLDEDYINQQEIRMNNLLKIKPEGNIELTNLFQYLKDNNFLFVDGFGHISVRITAEEIDIPQELFDKFLEDMEFLNDNVDKGLMIINKKSYKVESTIIDVKMKNDLLLEDNKFDENVDVDMIEFNEMNKHDIDNYEYVTEFDLVREVSSNYSKLVYYYSVQVEMKYNYPDLNIDPYLQTVLFWIYQVKPRGDWDYKTKQGFSPYNKRFICTQFSGNKVIRTSEFIGNYNYGYTGHFLFSLKVLKIGSFTVAILGDESTFDLANEYGDQQVIHFAYTDAEIFAR